MSLRSSAPEPSPVVGVWVVMRRRLCVCTLGAGDIGKKGIWAGTWKSDFRRVNGTWKSGCSTCKRVSSFCRRISLLNW